MNRQSKLNAQHTGLLALALSCPLAIFLAAVPVSGETSSAGGSASDALALTIYNQNFAVVKDVRSFDLKDGINYLRFEDVASRIDPTSVSFQSLTGPNSVIVREQNYEYDVMDPNTILSKSIGKQIKFRRYNNGGSVQETTGTLLNSPVVTISDTNGNTSERHQGLVVRAGDGVILNPQGEMELSEMPAGLISKPSLVWKLDCNKPGTHKSEIAYQTQGINWNCDYVSVLNKSDDKVDLTSWVTIDNKSGGAYKNASLKLMAGDVHRVTPQPMGYAKARMTMRGGANEMAPQFQEKAFAEYHLYSLQGKTDIKANETKQMSLFNAGDAACRKLFVYEPTRGSYGYYSGGGDQSKKVNVKIEIDNSAKNHLGMPMPKGKVRVYKKDDDGALQFIGEDQIDHTPRDEKLRLYIGDAFDVVGEYKQTSTNRISDHVQRASYEIELRNHKDTAINVIAVDHAWGDWTMLNSSIPHTKKDSRTFEFNVPVPARGSTKLTYEIESHY